jgi:hypothetical protein
MNPEYVEYKPIDNDKTQVIEHYAGGYSKQTDIIDKEDTPLNEQE